MEVIGQSPEAARTRTPLRFGPAWARAVVAGLLIAASLPPWGWWPLGFLGLAVWVELLDGEARRRRVLLSGLAAVSWLLPATLWMFDMTPPGWPAVVLAHAAMFSAVGLLTRPGEGRMVSFPAAFVAVELIRWNWPFGGVPIATLAMAQVASPLAPTARLFGSLFLTLVVALGGVLLAELFARHWRNAGLATVAVVASVVAGILAPGAHTVDTIDVALVQGGGPQNTRADLCQNRAVFERHMDASTLIETPVDLVVWPEDVVHPSPDGTRTPAACAEPLLTESEAAARLAGLAIDLDAVLVPGYFERSEDGSANLNYAVAITPEGETVDRYDKVRTVPFGEFVPLRGLVEAFSDEIPPRDVRPGGEPAILETPAGVFGVSISWEIFFDHRARDAIGNGGALLLNPTNGSSYWLTIVQTQQVASSRLRAIETDRWVAQVAPTGFSAVVTSDGDVIERTGISEQRVIHATVPLREGLTLAVRWGAWPAVGLALALLLVGHRRRALELLHRR
jgi:apolipoprotein N-acyltransferase